MVRITIGKPKIRIKKPKVLKNIEKAASKAVEDTVKTVDKAAKDTVKTVDKAAGDVISTAVKAKKDLDREATRARYDLEKTSHKMVYDAGKTIEKGFQDVGQGVEGIIQDIFEFIEENPEIVLLAVAVAGGAYLVYAYQYTVSVSVLYTSAAGGVAGVVILTMDPAEDEAGDSSTIQRSQKDENLTSHTDIEGDIPETSTTTKVSYEKIDEALTLSNMTISGKLNFVDNALEVSRGYSPTTDDAARFSPQESAIIASFGILDEIDIEFNGPLEGTDKDISSQVADSILKGLKFAARNYPMTKVVIETLTRFVNSPDAASPTQYDRSELNKLRESLKAEAAKYMELRQDITPMTPSEYNEEIKKREKERKERASSGVVKPNP